MFEIRPTVKQDTASLKKPLIKKVNEVLTGTPSRPFGFYDFIIVGTATFLYFFFIGIAVARGKRVPAAWIKIATKLNDGKVAEGIAKKGVNPKVPKANSITVREINQPTPEPIR